MLQFNVPTQSASSSSRSYSASPISTALSLRYEIFPTSLQRSLEFYTRIMRFSVRRQTFAETGSSGSDYAYLARGNIRVGLSPRSFPNDAASITQAQAYHCRHPPIGVELVFEFPTKAEFLEEREWILAHGKELEEDLVDRPWGLTDFRICDPDGYYLRFTHQAEPEVGEAPAEPSKPKKPKSRK